MIWENDLDKLKNENSERIQEMSGEMWDQLAPVCGYVSVSTMSDFEVELIKRDLIGMAEEAEIQQISLEEKLGMPTKEFGENLVESMRQKGAGRTKAAEIGMSFFSIVVRHLTFFWVMDRVFFREMDSINLVFVLCAIGMGIVGVGGLLVFKLAFDRRKRGLLEAGGIAILFILLFYFGREDYVITIGKQWNLLLGAVLITATVLSYVIQRWYWNRQAQRYEQQ